MSPDSVTGEQPDLSFRQAKLSHARCMSNNVSKPTLYLCFPGELSPASVLLCSEQHRGCLCGTVPEVDYPSSYQFIPASYKCKVQDGKAHKVCSLQ